MDYDNEQGKKKINKKLGRAVRYMEMKQGKKNTSSSVVLELYWLKM